MKLGQFSLYKRALANQEPDRRLFLALPLDAYDELLNDVFSFDGFQDLNQHFIILHPNGNLQWIK